MGLALAPFVVLVGVAVLTGNIGDLIHLWQSIVVFLAVLLPDRLYWLSHYPVEFRYEQHEQISHLFTAIGPYGGPWHSYLVRYLPHMLTMPLVPLAYFSTAWALIRCRPGNPEHTLSLWVLTYVVPLSLAVTKIENFVFAVLPAVALLVPRVLETLLRRRQFGLVSALCISAAAAFILPRLTGIGPGWTLLAAGAILAGALVVLFLLKLQSRVVATSVLALTSVALFSLYIHKDIFANTADPEDSRKQGALRQTGLDLRSLVDRNSLVLAHNTTSVTGAFLYIMYWSGVDVLDVCRPPARLANLRGRKDLYLITNAELPYTTIGNLPVGKLYALDQVPFEVWSPVVIAVCQ